jgi:hypothetical protein
LPISQSPPVNTVHTLFHHHPLVSLPWLPRPSVNPPLRGPSPPPAKVIFVRLPLRITTTVSKTPVTGALRG